jgi:hypothetical protein
MPWMEIEKELSGEIATKKTQNGDFRVFKSHMTYNELLASGLVPMDATTSAPSKPLPGVVYPRIVYCFRDMESKMISSYQFLPTTMHIIPSTIPFNSFVSSREALLRAGLNSLVDFWKHRHQPNIMVSSTLLLFSI